MKPKIKYAYDPNRKEWIGAVYMERHRGASVILTVGCEATKRDIRVWCQRAKEKRPWLPDGEPVLDMYDRKKQGIDDDEK